MSYDCRCFFMYDNKTILKFHFDEVSIRQIAERSKKSRNTISRIITASKSVNLTPEQLDSLSDDELTLLLFPNKELMPVYAQSDYAYCHKELTKPGVTLSTLYQEYVFQCQSAHVPFYKSSYFFEKYADYFFKSKVSVKLYNISNSI